MTRTNNSDAIVEDAAADVTHKVKDKAVELTDAAEGLFSRAKKFAQERPAAALGLGILALWIGRRVLR